MSDHEHVVLCVDDEENILRALKRILRRENYRLLTATTGKEGLRLLREHEVHLVISDQRMPEMSGAEFLGKVKENFPDVIRVCLTGYTDVDSITESINQGHIYKFFLKPWNDQSLKLEIRQALDQYELKKTNMLLHEKLLKQNEELKAVNENLEKLVLARTEELEIKNQALELSHAVLEDLPVAIIGMSPDEMVVLVNKAAQALPIGESGISVGKNVSHYFSSDFGKTASNTLEKNVPHVIGNFPIGSRDYRIDFLPLSGRFEGKGIIIIFSVSSHALHDENDNQISQACDSGAFETFGKVMGHGGTQ